jgi:hypothetical protein
MDIKSMADVGIDLDAGINRLTIRNIAEHTALGISQIHTKLTADTSYTNCSLSEAKITLGKFAGQNLVTRLVAGEIVYYPLGEVKLTTTGKCENPICENGYLGNGFPSTEIHPDLQPPAIICIDCNACELTDTAGTIIY